MCYTLPLILPLEYSHTLMVYCYEFVSDSGKFDKMNSHAGKSHIKEIILISKNATAHDY